MTCREQLPVLREAKKGGRVVFVGSAGLDASQVKNVFVASMQQGKLGVVMSSAGHQGVPQWRSFHGAGKWSAL